MKVAAERALKKAPVLDVEDGPYNQFLDRVDTLLRQGGYEGEFQVASFHPDYQFAGTRPSDAENYSSRSPYPLLHILRESSISAAISQYPDIDDIPARNIDTLNAMGSQQLQALWQACFHDGAVES